MTVEELKSKIDSKVELNLLDVRDPEEFQYANIGGIHIPLDQLTQRYSELDPSKEWIVICHHGMRSAHAVGFLRNAGFEKVHNLSGGIEAWSTQIDPAVPRY